MNLTTLNDEGRTMKDEGRTMNERLGLKFRSTFDIIKAAEEGRLPDKIMFTFHPQRWHDRPLPWVKELAWQNVKNQIKKYVVGSKK
jgi:hypothetical protein